MEWLRKFKIADKLKFLIFVNLVFLFFVGFAGTKGVISLGAQVKSMYEYLSPIQRLNTLKTNLATEDGYSLLAISETNASSQATYYKEVENIKKSTDESFAKYATSSGLFEEERATLPKLQSLLQKHYDVSTHIMKLASSNKKQESFNYYKKISLPLFYELDGVISKLVKINIDTAEADNLKALNYVKSSVIFQVVTSIFALILAIIFGYIVTQMITRPVKDAIDNLSAGTDEVSINSSRVADTSHVLTEGASKQAAAIQETSSTLEETSSMVHQNRENTQQAASLAKQAKQYAEKSNDEMGKMMISMSDLKNSSNEIAKIIKVIDDIAFQTNILSLNAAVEAARAGDAGKGFAVVAEEVRNLAQRSAQAAKDTTIIIEGNIELSDSSVNIARMVKESVEAIGEQATKVSELLDEIAVATNEQAQGVGQINQAVSQIEIALQSNAATTDENVANSNALQEQVVNLREIVNSLVVLVDGAKSAS